ncbi:MAG TPA: hypothetical protein VF618_14085 [Thermoanaerobaculia bacterium]
MIIEVCSRDEASEILSSPEGRADVTFLVSIGGREDQPPHGYGSVERKLRLLFDDTTDQTGATEDDVRRIIDAARELPPGAGRVIIHCAAGISRSAAAAVIFHAIRLGPGHEEDAVDRVMEQRPIAMPNPRIIAIADQLLELDGALVTAVKARRHAI